MSLPFHAAADRTHRGRKAKAKLGKNPHFGKFWPSIIAKTCLNTNPEQHPAGRGHHPDALFRLLCGTIIGKRKNQDRDYFP